MTKSGLAPHGTFAAYKRHRRAKEQPCRPCLDAYNEYCRAYNRRPEVRRKDYLNTRARELALAELARRHPDEFRAINEETKRIVDAEQSATDSVAEGVS